MKIRSLIAPCIASLLCLPASAQIPGATVGANCDEFFKHEVASGAIVKRKQAVPPGVVTRLDSQFRGRATIAEYTCERGVITRQFLVISLSNEVDAIDLFHNLRNQLESEYGEPFFDGTRPEKLDPLTKFDPDPESARREFRFYARWLAKGEFRSVGVSHVGERWAVTLAFSVEPAAFYGADAVKPSDSSR